MRRDRSHDPTAYDYLMVSQQAVRIEHYHRQDEETSVLRTFGPDKLMIVESLGIGLSINDLFGGIVAALS